MDFANRCAAGRDLRACDVRARRQHAHVGNGLRDQRAFARAERDVTLRLNQRRTILRGRNFERHVGAIRTRILRALEIHFEGETLVLLHRVHRERASAPAWLGTRTSIGPVAPIVPSVTGRASIR